MKRISHLIAVMATALCGLGAQAQTPVDTVEHEVLLETTKGNIRVKLFNDTPRHRDHFMKLVREGYYNGLLFHRVIPDFMIQAGDPSSKNAPKGARLGEQSLDYNIPAEIRLPQIFHKRGTLAAAREPDIVNPMHESSSSQFYIVIGKKQDEKGLERGRKNLQKLFGDSLTMTKEMENTYRTIGGTPHLDGAYTVFGEVTEGMDVVEKIQNVERDEYDRLVEDVRIIKATILKDMPGYEKKQVKRTVKKPVRRKR